MKPLSVTDSGNNRALLLNWDNCIFAQAAPEGVDGSRGPTFILLVTNGSARTSLSVKESIEDLKGQLCDGREER